MLALGVLVTTFGKTVLISPIVTSLFLLSFSVFMICDNCSFTCLCLVGGFCPATPKCFLCLCSACIAMSPTVSSMCWLSCTLPPRGAVVSIDSTVITAGDSAGTSATFGTVGVLPLCSIAQVLPPADISCNAFSARLQVSCMADSSAAHTDAFTI